MRSPRARPRARHAPAAAARRQSPPPRLRPRAPRVLSPFPRHALRVAAPEAADAAPATPSPTPASDGGATRVDPPFTLAQLATFRTATAAGSVDAAADALGRVPSKVAAALAKLEAGVGHPLLASASPLRLTPAGALLDRYAERVLALGADALAAAADAGGGGTGHVFVAASQTVGNYALPPAIERFRRAHPGVSVSLQVENTRRCCAAVADGSADVALVGGAVPPDLAPSLRAVPFCEDEVVLVVPPDHPLARAGDVDRDALPGLAFVSLHKSSTLAGVRSTLAAAGVDWRSLPVVLEVNSVEAIKSAVEAGMGAAFVSAAAVRKEAALGVLSLLRITGVPLTRTLHAVVDPTRYLPRAAVLFCEEECGLDLSSSAGGGGRGGARAGGPLSAAPSPSCSRYPHLAHRTPPLSELAGGVDAAAAAAAAPPPPTGPSRTPPARAELPFTLAQLATLQAVARTGSGVAASLALGVSQPAVSKSLAALEAALGAGPLVRPGRRAGPSELTEAGATMLPHIERTLAAAREAAAALADMGAAGAGAVRLGASQTVGTYVMPRLLATFRAANPRVTVQLTVDSTRRACEGVAAGALDAAIVGGGVPADLAPKLTVSPYAADEVVLIVPAGHALAGRGPAPLAALPALTLVGLEAGSSVRAAQDATLANAGVPTHALRTDMEFSSVEAIKGAVQHGLGAAFVSRAAIEKEVALGLVAAVPLDGVSLTRTLWLVAPRSPRAASPAAAKFLADVGATSAGVGAGGLPLRGVGAPARRPWADER
jgi:DNA-binding transcriptional LysR family regulator